MLEMKEFGKNIARLRRLANMTQMRLAEELQVSFQAVSNWERGLTLPDITKLPELAQLFTVSIDELFGLKIKTEQSPETEPIPRQGVCPCPQMTLIRHALSQSSGRCENCPWQEQD
ncbi:MAG: helix-turn-helix domain-containing protein [Symbiobacteriaceae bacterium]|nr:helix-turn-helix domain-containing protein [Symbiobacteriaceae bacterium]